MYNTMADFDAGNALAELTSAVAQLPILNQISRLRRATCTTSAEPPGILHAHAATQEHCYHSHTLDIFVESGCQAMVNGCLRG